MAEPVSETEPNILFHKALTTDDYKRVYALLADGADVDHGFRSSFFYKCPVHICCEKGNIETLKVLIHWKADLECPDQWGQRPLHYSVMKRQHKILKLLLEKGVEVNAVNKHVRSPLHYAVELGDRVMLEMLLENGARVNIQEQNGQTPVHVAASRNIYDWSLTRMLEQGDVIVDLWDRNKKTALQHAVLTGSVNGVKALLMAKADPDVFDTDYMTPLLNAIIGFNRSAVEEIYLEKTECLIKFGADVNKANPTTGRTPLHVLVGTRQNCVRLGQLLITFGADINQKDVNGCTPLILALLAGNKQAVRLLLRHNCDTSPVGTVQVLNNVTHVNALDICITHQLLDMLELLFEAGAKLDCTKYFEKLFGDLTYLTDLPPLLDTLKFHLTNVSPLKTLCRTSIRSSCGVQPEDWIGKLGLPKYLMRYVLLENELLEE
ncbi:ankyrin-1-like [Lineus longissimus]|uniref:ankyrin-1-like n=1 Tax=Lineus longissimus TaxID=88925 RepID=UPI00315DFC8B